MPKYGVGVRIWLALLVLSSSSIVTAQRGAITSPRNLAQLTARAATIVQGRIISVSVEPHPLYTSLNSVVVTVAVDDTLKGTAQKSLTFRQFIWDPRDRTEHAGYREGEEIVLFLNRKTELGFTSPVGLGQGRFHVFQDPSGRQRVASESQSRTLFDGMQNSVTLSRLSAHARQVVTAPTQQPLTLDVLKEIVRSLSNLEPAP